MGQPGRELRERKHHQALSVREGRFAFAHGSASHFDSGSIDMNVNILVTFEKFSLDFELDKLAHWYILSGLIRGDFSTHERRRLACARLSYVVREYLRNRAGNWMADEGLEIIKGLSDSELVRARVGELADRIRRLEDGVADRREPVYFDEDAVLFVFVPCCDYCDRRVGSNSIRWTTPDGAAYLACEACANVALTA